jgi:isoleucyl-tRNA synthetase
LLFGALEISMNFNEREKKILKFWKEKNIFKKSLEKTKNGKSFVFYDGPITVNAQPGIHHIEARIYKDIIPRYKTMRGFSVSRKNGWDTHGLPVEIEVEKKLGFKSKKDIEDYGIIEFNQECKKTVDELIPVFRKITERIGYWVDMDNPYITYKPEYIETVWWALKQIWNRGLLYEDFKVMPWCARCETCLSSHELAQGYKNIYENSVYIQLRILPNQKIKDFPLNKNAYFLTWTTTPWTLPGNTALAIGTNLDYCLVKTEEENYILAKSKLEILEKKYKIIKEFKGKDLEGIGYFPLFDIKETQNSASHKVYPANFVTEEDGTGLVHIAVMYGADDFELGTEYSLPKVHTVSENGEFNNLVKDFEGKRVKDKETEKSIIEYLKKKKFFFKEKIIQHDYPFCWRCKEPLLYYAKKSWFIKMTDVQEELLGANEKINWMPAYLKTGRFGEWLREVKDWAITRERYWGTPFPVWKCEKCNKQKCIGSFKELGQEIKDPHRPYIDKIDFKCECGGKMKREPYVIDVWFDSGAMPFAQAHFPFALSQNKKTVIIKNKDFNKPELFPADYISEAIDQTRGWFYTLLAISVLLGHESPYKNILCLGHVLDKKGEKMSKSKGNIILPDEIINKYGADALRWYFFTVNQPEDPKRFNEKDVKNASSKLLLIRHIINFLDFYGLTINSLTQKELKDFDPKNILDIWLLARLNCVNEEVSNLLDNYRVVEAARLIEVFIDDISYRYIHWSRSRFKASSPNRKEGATTLVYSLFVLSKLIAPFVPFLAEEIFGFLKKGPMSKDKELKESVHLEDWPNAQKIGAKEKKILDKILLVEQIISLGLRARKGAKLKVRQPLSEIKLNINMETELLEIIEKELNVKKAIVDKKLKNEKGWVLDKENSVSIMLNIELSDKLIKEGSIREILRNIQILRKKAGFTPQDMSEIEYVTESSKIKSLLILNKKKIKLFTNTANIIAKTEDLSSEYTTEIQILDSSIKIGIKRYNK